MWNLYMSLSQAIVPSKGAALHRQLTELFGGSCKLQSSNIMDPHNFKISNTMIKQYTSKKPDICWKDLLCKKANYRFLGAQELQYLKMES